MGGVGVRPLNLVDFMHVAECVRKGPCEEHIYWGSKIAAGDSGVYPQSSGK